MAREILARGPPWSISTPVLIAMLILLGHQHDIALGFHLVIESTVDNIMASFLCAIYV